VAAIATTTGGTAHSRRFNIYRGTSLDNGEPVPSRAPPPHHVSSHYMQALDRCNDSNGPHRSAPLRRSPPKRDSYLYDGPRLHSLRSASTDRAAPRTGSRVRHSPSPAPLVTKPTGGPRRKVLP
jgi:hypothetical protein